MALFSIVVPVYNVERYLDECLQSIVPQIINSEFEAEVNLVDDGATDSSGVICDQYAEKYPGFVKVFNKENEGSLQTRRYGLSKATGKYIINCDSDDKLFPTALNELYNIVYKTNADVVIYNLEILKDFGKTDVFFNNVFSENIIEEIDKKDVIR